MCQLLLEIKPRGARESRTVEGMVPRVQQGLPFDRASRTSNSVRVETSMATSTGTLVYVYETNNINADPLTNTGYLVTLHLGEGTPMEIMYKLAQQFTGSRCFVHSLDEEEFQGWKEVTEMNVKSIGENLLVRNQMKVVKPTSVLLEFHEFNLMDKIVSAIVEKLTKEILRSSFSSINKEDDLNMKDETSSFNVHPVKLEEEVALFVEPERHCLVGESLGNKNWAQVRERAHGVLELKYS